MFENAIILESSSIMRFCRCPEYGRHLCYRQKYLEQLCQMFHITVMKFVRISVNLISTYLDRPSSRELHVIYLVRDPRAIMNSRWGNENKGWCSKSSDCNSVEVLCRDMEEDLSVILKLTTHYSDKVHIVRYEDIALDPGAATQKMLQSLGIDYHEDIRSYIDTHTRKNVDNTKSYRQSETRVAGWVSEMQWDEVDSVQRACSDIMKKFGYIYLPSNHSGNDISNILSPMIY